MKTKVTRVNLSGLVGFAWEATAISYFVKTINGVVEVLKTDITNKFNTLLINTKRIETWKLSA